MGASSSRRCHRQKRSLVFTTVISREIVTVYPFCTIAPQLLLPRLQLKKNLLPLISVTRELGEKWQQRWRDNQEIQTEQNPTSKEKESPNKRTLGWALRLLKVHEMKAQTGLPGELQAWGALRRHISDAHGVCSAEPPAKGTSQWEEDKDSQELSPQQVPFISYVPTTVTTQHSANISQMLFM